MCLKASLNNKNNNSIHIINKGRHSVGWYVPEKIHHFDFWIRIDAHGAIECLLHVVQPPLSSLVCNREWCMSSDQSWMTCNNDWFKRNRVATIQPKVSLHYRSKLRTGIYRERWMYQFLVYFSDFFFCISWVQILNCSYDFLTKWIKHAFCCIKLHNTGLNIAAYPQTKINYS